MSFASRIRDGTVCLGVPVLGDGGKSDCPDHVSRIPNIFRLQRFTIVNALRALRGRESRYVNAVLFRVANGLGCGNRHD